MQTEFIKVWHTPFGNVIKGIEPESKEVPHQQLEEIEDTELTQQELDTRATTRALIIAERAKAKTKRNRLLALTEHFDWNAQTACTITRSGAVMKHLMCFSIIAEHAISHNYRIGYGEFRKRIKKAKDKNNVALEWRNITKWLGRNTNKAIVAVSIGVGSGGWVYIRFIVTSDIDVNVCDISIAISYYLRNNRKFFPKELKPYEKNPQQFIKDKYIHSNLADILEVNKYELWQSMRASLVLPQYERTNVSDETEMLLNSYSDVDNTSKCDDDGFQFNLGKAFAEPIRDDTGTITGYHVLSNFQKDDEPKN